MRAAVAIVLMLFTSIAMASPCDFTSAWLNSRQSRVDLTGQVNQTLARYKWQQNIESNKKISAENAFEEYITGQLSPGSFQQCMTADELKDFLPAANEVFFNRSLEILERSAAPELRLIAKLTREKIAKSNLIIFSFAGHTLGDSRELIKDSNATATYNRDLHSIYADIDAIAPGEWLISFCHELAHYIDGDHFSMANTIYNEEKRDHHFLNLAQSTSDPSHLAPADQTRFDVWMNAALDRGFFGEYRAWAVTLILYRAGLRAGVWNHVEWLDRWLGDSSNIPQTAFQTLDGRFTNPDPQDSSSEEFQSDLFQNELKKVRDQARQHLPPLYELSVFFAGKNGEK
jgi:hypothetical protein